MVQSSKERAIKSKLSLSKFGDLEPSILSKKAKKLTESTNPNLFLRLDRISLAKPDPRLLIQKNLSSSLHPLLEITALLIVSRNFSYNLIADTDNFIQNRLSQIARERVRPTYERTTQIVRTRDAMDLTGEPEPPLRSEPAETVLITEDFEDGGREKSKKSGKVLF